MDSTQPRGTTSSLFLEGLITELETYHSTQGELFATKARTLVRNVFQVMFTKVLYFNPDANLWGLFKKIHESAELEVARQATIPIADKVAAKCS